MTVEEAKQLQVRPFFGGQGYRKTPKSCSIVCIVCTVSVCFLAAGKAKGSKDKLVHASSFGLFCFGNGLCHLERRT